MKTETNQTSPNIPKAKLQITKETSRLKRYHE